MRHVPGHQSPACRPPAICRIAARHRIAVDGEGERVGALAGRSSALAKTRTTGALASASVKAYRPRQLPLGPGPMPRPTRGHLAVGDSGRVDQVSDVDEPALLAGAVARLVPGAPEGEVDRQPAGTCLPRALPCARRGSALQRRRRHESAPGSRMRELTISGYEGRRSGGRGLDSLRAGPPSCLTPSRRDPALPRYIKVGEG